MKHALKNMTGDRTLVQLGIFTSAHQGTLQQVESFIRLVADQTRGTEGANE
jgi:hypothetical protein